MGTYLPHGGYEDLKTKAHNLRHRRDLNLNFHPSLGLNLHKRRDPILHHRPCGGDPWLRAQGQTLWMAGTSPAMEAGVAA